MPLVMRLSIQGVGVMSSLHGNGLLTAVRRVAGLAAQQHLVLQAGRSVQMPIRKPYGGSVRGNSRILQTAPSFRTYVAQISYKRRRK